MMLELNEENFEKTINASTPTVVDFWASWCGPCRMMAPAFEQVGKELAGKAKFAKISTEDFPDIASANQITGIPCLIVFKNGEEMDRIVGFSPASMLKQKIEKVLAGI